MRTRSHELWENKEQHCLQTRSKHDGLKTFAAARTGGLCQSRRRSFSLISARSEKLFWYARPTLAEMSLGLFLAVDCSSTPFHWLGNLSTAFRLEHVCTANPTSQQIRLSGRTRLPRMGSLSFKTLSTHSPSLGDVFGVFIDASPFFLLRSTAHMTPTVLCPCMYLKY